MKSVQYTIRSIPPKVDEVLRKRARQQGKSFNQTVVEALKQAAGVTDKPVVHHDLDWFIGSGALDQKSFDEAMQWLDSLPNDLEANF